MKRILALVLLCALLPVGLTALGEAAFTFDAKTGTITGYTGDGGVVQVPAAIDGVPVRVLGVGAFDQNSAITQVVLPEGLTHILSNAFYFCDNLETVRFPGTLQVVDNFAFFSCKQLTDVSLPPALVSIGEQAFGSCDKLTVVRFTGMAPVIGAKAFVYGPEGRQFFAPGDQQQVYEAALGAACVPEGYAVVIPPQTEVLFDAARGAVTGYLGQGADLHIPAAIDGVRVLSIDEKAFFGEQLLRRVTLPEGLTHISKQAFYGTKLAQVNLPGTLTGIGDGAFGGAPLQNLELPDSLSTLGVGAFAHGRFTDLRIPNGVTHIPERAFEACWLLENLTLPAVLQGIGALAFRDCDAMHYLVFEGDTVPDIAPDAFLECERIEDVDIKWDADKARAEAFREAFLRLGVPEAQLSVWRANPADEPPYPTDAAFTFDDDSQLITSYQGSLSAMTMFWNHWNKDGSAALTIKGLGPGVFENSSLRTFNVPHSNAFELIGERAFAGSALERIYLFDSVTDIGAEAFKGCANLNDILLPSSVERIGENAFLGCEALERVVLPAGVSLAGDLGLPPERVFIAKDATDEQAAALSAALNYPWYLTLLREGEQSAFVPMPDSFIANPAAEFTFDPETGAITGYTGSAEVVVVPREIGGVPVTAIAYPGFSNLTVLSVAQGTQDNVSLKHIILPETVREIADSAFLNCAALKRVDCYGPVDRVGIRAFEQCTALEEVAFHNGVREMGIYCFNQCESLKTVQLDNKIDRLPEGAFWGCGFEELALTVPRIDGWAFKDCKSVRTIRVMPAVQSLGEGVFQGMGALKTVYFERPDPDILLEGGMQFDPTASGLKVALPPDATEEQQAGFAARLKANMLPGEAMVVLEPWQEAPPEAAADAPATTAVPQADVSPVPQPTASTPTEPAATGELRQNTLYRVARAETMGFGVDLALIGEYSVIFHENGKATLTLAGSVMPPLNWKLEGTTPVVDHFGQPLPFTWDGEDLVLNYYDTMLLTMKAE